MDKVAPNDIEIRTDLRSGDIGYITFLHGTLYKKEYGYGIAFEAYVAKGLHEFYERYDPSRSRVWICEHQGKIIGSLFLMDRGESAQLRYFILEPAHRGIGLGNRLMFLFVTFLKDCRYSSAYLWTTDELFAAAHLYKKYGFVLTEEVDSEAFEKPLKENKYELKFN